MYPLGKCPLAPSVSDLGVPVGVVEEIVERAGRVTQRASKSKPPIKNKGDADHKF